MLSLNAHKTGLEGRQCCPLSNLVTVLKYSSIVFVFCLFYCLFSCASMFLETKHPGVWASHQPKWSGWVEYCNAYNYLRCAGRSPSLGAESPQFVWPLKCQHTTAFYWLLDYLHCVVFWHRWFTVISTIFASFYIFTSNFVCLNWTICYLALVLDGMYLTVDLAIYV